MQPPDVPETFRFGDFELDVAGYSLRRGGQQVRLERRPMDLLILLVQRRRELVSRNDIVERLWGPGVFGQPGVERVLEIKRVEARAAMQQYGVRSVKKLNPSFVRRAT